MEVILMTLLKYLGICKVYVLTSFVNTQTKLGAYETFMASLTTYVRSTIYPSRHATSFQRLYDVYTTSATIQLELWKTKEYLNTSEKVNQQ